MLPPIFKQIIVFILVVLLTSIFGCVSTQSVATRLGDKYVGKNFDEFVLAHGAPQQTFKLSSGDIIYVWNSGTSSIKMPTTATTTSYGNQATTMSSGGERIDMFCEVQFVTSPQRIIKRITIIKDTVGFWTSSRCHEVFE